MRKGERGKNKLERIKQKIEYDCICTRFMQYTDDLLIILQKPSSSPFIHPFLSHSLPHPFWLLSFISFFSFQTDLHVTVISQSCFHNCTLSSVFTHLCLTIKMLPLGHARDCVVHVHVTYAADPGSNPGRRSFAAFHVPLSPTIFTVMTVSNKCVYA